MSPNSDRAWIDGYNYGVQDERQRQAGQLVTVRGDMINQYGLHVQYVIDLTMALKDFERLIDALDVIADRYRNDNLKAALEGWISKLIGAYGQIVHTSNRPTFTVDLDPGLRVLYEEHLQGLRNLENDIDAGESLRNAAQPGELVRILRATRDLVSVGRPRDAAVDVLRNLKRKFEPTQGKKVKLARAIRDYLFNLENPSEAELLAIAQIRQYQSEEKLVQYLKGIRD